MALALKSSCFLQLKKPEAGFQASFSSKRAIISVKRYTPVAAIKTMEAVGLSATFTRLKKEGKVCFFSCFHACHVFHFVLHFQLNSIVLLLPACFFRF